MGEKSLIGETEDVKKVSVNSAWSELTPPAVALGPGGTGLPPVEMFLQRHLIFPVLCTVTSFEGALRLFEKESRSLIAEVGMLAPLARERRILVPRLPAIEDCSRFWSAAMVLEHLIITGTSIQGVAQYLAAGRKPPGQASISAIKPRGELTGEACVDSFIEFSSEFVHTVRGLSAAKSSKVTFKHPWFGEINLHQWVCLAAIHQRIHRRQVEAIISRL